MLAFALQAVAAFNLICSVTYAGEPGQTSTLVIRVDLDARRYCMDDCREAIPLSAVTDTRITFNDGPSPYSDAFVRRFVNRESGAYQAYVRIPVVGGVSETRATGTCERAPFTGFPQRRF